MGCCVRDPPGSIYLVAGPADASQPFPLGAVQTFSDVVAEAVPEPSSLALSLVLFVSGGVFLLWRQRRQRAAATSVETPWLRSPPCFVENPSEAVDPQPQVLPPQVSRGIRDRGQVRG